VDPRPWAAPEIAAVYAAHPHLGSVLPAVGYSPAQLDALRRTLDAVDADVIVSGTPADLAALVPLRKPVVRARYELAELEEPGLGASREPWSAGTRPARPRSRA
jgi:predicted GTPase